MIEDKTDSSNPHQVAKLIRLMPILISTIVILTIISATLIYAYYLTQMNKKIFTEPGDGTLNLTIDKGMSTTAVGEYLKEKGLIEEPLLLRAYMFINKDKVIQAGFYRPKKKDLTLVKLVDEFQQGSFEKKLTFIEGWRVEEYLNYLKKKTTDEFVKTFATSTYVKEGYMFPDTYIIDQGYNPEDLASWMRNNFTKRVDQSLIDKAEFKGMNLDEVVILASIVEREMNVSRERPIVAGILIKRLRNGWALQADSTVQYSLGKEGKWWPTLVRADLRSGNSPYNTYIRQGLPPAPICNPSLDSIMAVVNYQESPYWFYATGKDGITRYAKTLDEHNRNVAKYL